jgi:hypothetical protein
MTLPPAVQAHVEAIIQLLGITGPKPSSMRIDFDDEGQVQKLTPETTFRRRRTDRESKS